VTTFVNAQVCKDGTTLHFPILRPSILSAMPVLGDHVCVYFNEGADHDAIAYTLQQVPARFVIYGAPRVTQDTTTNNVTHRPFSETGFIRDLATSKAVIGGAGFTFMTEAIYLNKPMLAVPFEGYFEQILNANYLELMGYGERGRVFDAVGVMGFLGRVEKYRKNLTAFRHDGNRELFQAVEAAIAGG
jgi:uncharacterized protein (TIGR00661 family)